jgi:hypothetical protein
MADPVADEELERMESAGDLFDLGKRRGLHITELEAALHESTEVVRNLQEKVVRTETEVVETMHTITVLAKCVSNERELGAIRLQVILDEGEKAKDLQAAVKRVEAAIADEVVAAATMYGSGGASFVASAVREALKPE